VTEVAAALFNDVFRGRVYGRHDIFTPATFRDFVRAYDVDLSRATVLRDGHDVAGAVAFALRGNRAWFALIGVKPKYRRRGYGSSLLQSVVDDAMASGARSMEFEVMQHNAIAVAMYRKIGFETIDELAIWSRAPRTNLPVDLVPRKHSERSVRAIARRPAVCWQREPRSVILAAPSALVECDGAYAFVRVRGEYASLLDAGARDERAARALLKELDRRVPYDLTLLNEPLSSPLTGALRDCGWRLVKRQYRMIKFAAP
jgi:ribosomal protein S18 acetylase RimI-like enzyme